MDLSKLTLGDKLVGGGGIALFIASFLPWFGFSERGFGSVSWNGWDTGFIWGGLPALLGLALAGLIAVRAFSPETKLPDLPVAWGLAILIAAGFAAFWVVLKLLIGESVFGVSIDRQWGLFVAVIAAGVLVAGGFFKFKEEEATTAPGSTPPQPF